MPKGKTDIKRFEKQEKRRVRNRAVRSSVRTYVSRARESIAGGEEEPMLESVRRAMQALDRAAKKGVLHPNNVARRKSRLMKRVNAASAATA